MSKDIRFVGPDNGLFEILLRRANNTSFRRITGTGNLSASFHGRDLFAPVAAHLAKGEEVQSEARPVDEATSPLARRVEEIIYLDNFGNAMTGVRPKHTN